LLHNAQQLLQAQEALQSFMWKHFPSVTTQFAQAETTGVTAGATTDAQIVTANHYVSDIEYIPKPSVEIITIVSTYRATPTLGCNFAWLF
jgi:hypothetical protein